MKILRAIWVLLANGTAVYLMYRSAQQLALLDHLLEQDHQNRGVWLHFALRVTIPILGILLELLGSRLAKWVNVGYFAFAGVVLSAIAILNWSDYHGRVHLLFGLPALAASLVTYLLYRHPRKTTAAPASP